MQQLLCNSKVFYYSFVCSHNNFMRWVLLLSSFLQMRRVVERLASWSHAHVNSPDSPPRQQSLCWQLLGYTWPVCTHDAVYDNTLIKPTVELFCTSDPLSSLMEYLLSSCVVQQRIFYNILLNCLSVVTLSLICLLFFKSFSGFFCLS